MLASCRKPVRQWARLQCPLRPAALPPRRPCLCPTRRATAKPPGLATPSSGPTRFFPVDSARLPPGQGSVRSPGPAFLDHVSAGSTAWWLRDHLLCMFPGCHSKSVPATQWPRHRRSQPRLTGARQSRERAPTLSCRNPRDSACEDVVPVTVFPHTERPVSQTSLQPQVSGRGTQRRIVPAGPHTPCQSRGGRRDRRLHGALRWFADGAPAGRGWSQKAACSARGDVPAAGSPHLHTHPARWESPLARKYTSRYGLAVFHSHAAECRPVQTTGDVPEDARARGREGRGRGRPGAPEGAEASWGAVSGLTPEEESEEAGRRETWRPAQVAHSNASHGTAGAAAGPQRARDGHVRPPPRVSTRPARRQTRPRRSREGAEAEAAGPGQGGWRITGRERQGQTRAGSGGDRTSAQRSLRM